MTLSGLLTFKGRLTINRNLPLQYKFAADCVTNSLMSDDKILHLTSGKGKVDSFKIFDHILDTCCHVISCIHVWCLYNILLTVVN